MSNTKRLGNTFGAFTILAVALVLLSNSVVQAQYADGVEDAQLLENWDELMHYALIGNWELAAGYGQALLDGSPDPIDLLMLAESDRYAHSYRNLTMLEENTPLSEIAAQILAAVEQGRFLRRTDAAGIEAEVRRLSGTTRGRMMAINRLKDSGEWAVPIMIEAVRDPSRTAEIPLIQWALPQLGRPAVNPLVIVLQNCRDLNVQLLALDALGKIGYRTALPYIKAIMENEQAPMELVQAAQTAFNMILRSEEPMMLSGNEANTSAAELFLQLAENYYNNVPSLEVPSNQALANVWFWDRRAGLVKEEVPRDSFDELMAMRACEDAISLDADLSDAIALWLSSFFRLEADGFMQPSYFGANHADAATYALTAGPEYLQRVLGRALDNVNRPVALAAIHTLQLNSGQNSLLYSLSGRQPLVEALSFPDREVRYSAALAIADVAPSEAFVQSSLVLPILAEALQQRGQRVALVADPDQDRRNALVADLRNTAGYDEVIAGASFTEVMSAAREVPSVELVVLADNISNPVLQSALDEMQESYHLAFCPTIIVSVTDLSLLGIDEETYRFVDSVIMPDVATIEEKVSLILDRNNARAFAASLADFYATLAGRTLRALAISGNEVLDVQAAERALLAAAHDDRPEIQSDAVETLSHIDSADAQRAIADLALNEDVPSDTRLLALRCLAASAKQYGHLLMTSQVDALYAIVASLEADEALRILAAQAYGSLDLPSARVSELITSQASGALAE
ncbi:MAG: hypothetical protein JW936_00010 [Sedimentisphaerales bacterium]|nr:hypothetical protein [Sedimentisphaerales bacterium]